VTDRGPSVEVSRRINATPERIFEILANPERHTDLDGSGMLRGVITPAAITGVGDVFSMRMHFDPIGDYVMLNYVVEFEPHRRIGWEPAPGDAVASEDGVYPIGVPAGHRWSFELTPDGEAGTIVTEIFDCTNAPEDLQDAVDRGETWRDAMAATLELLDEVSQR
jgi:uncharacterized protein YndB with AHSA1/START domain